MKYAVICGGESGWRYHRGEEGDNAHCRETPLIITDGEGKAQGVSIERGLLVKDVIGRLIVIQEVEICKKEEGEVQERIIRKKGPALGVIGCQCSNIQ
jgi:hypothetical protein